MSSISFYFFSLVFYLHCVPTDLVNVSFHSIDYAIIYPIIYSWALNCFHFFTFTILLKWTFFFTFPCATVQGLASAKWSCRAGPCLLLKT